MIAAIRARCPAKINLRLEVLGRRPDGFHEIRTLFQAIDLEDEVEARHADGLVLECDDPALPTDRRNLVLRAAEALAERLGDPSRGARLTLRKRIPVGGGLGGGSANAAGALVALSRLWESPLRHDELAELAASLGADVPFFLVGGTAYGWGRGERVRPLPALPPTSILLGAPPFPISTAEVYAAHAERVGTAGRLDPLTPENPGVTVPASFLKLIEENDFGQVRNDLEPTVLEGWPELGRFRSALDGAGARAACVSGSGSTVFGVFEAKSDASRAAEALVERFPGWRLLLARTVGDGARVVDPEGRKAAGGPQ